MPLASIDKKKKKEKKPYLKKWLQDFRSKLERIIFRKPYEEDVLSKKYAICPTRFFGVKQKAR